MDVPKFKDIFQQINLNLKLCGISADSMLGLKFYILLVLFIILMIIEEGSFFFSKISSENFLELTALAPCIGIGILSAAKILSMGLNRHKMFKLMDCLDMLYDEILHGDDYKKEIVRREIVPVKRLTKYYFILNAILISVYNFTTLLLMMYDYVTKGVVNFTLPFAVIVPFSTDIWQNWLLVYTHSIACGFICVLYYTTVDALYCNLTSQVCCNFSIISYEVERLTPANAHTIRDIVKRHQYVLELADILEEIFTAINLYNVLVGSVEICALGFNLTTGDWSKIPGYILFLSSELLQILVLSVFGENIIRESQGVGDAAFLCEWYKMEEKYKKMILIIMARSQKPQRLTAYNFSTISYGSFTKIISTSWSYFTILRTVYKPDAPVEQISTEL